VKAPGPCLTALGARYGVPRTPTKPPQGVLGLGKHAGPRGSQTVWMKHPEKKSVFVILFSG